MNANDLVVKANNRWKSLYAWQPILIAISIAMIVAIAHKVDWETTTVTNPSEIWESRKITENENETVIVFDQEINDSVIIKGVLKTSPKFEVYSNDTIVLGRFSKGEGIVYSEELYGKTMLNVSGMRILVNGNLDGKFYESEIVTVEATLVERLEYYDKNDQNITLNSEIWVAEPDDVKLASEKDYYYFALEILILGVGTYFTIKRTKNLKEQMGFAKHIALFELKRGMKAPRMIVLGLFFTLFIVGIGWLLGDLQNIQSTFVVQNADDGIIRLAYFTFFVVSMAAIAVSVDSFHRERQSNTLNMLLARPVNRETIVLGKALGLSLVVGIPAFLAQILGLYFMTSAGDMPSLGGMIAFLIFGQVMIFTMITFQLCLAVSAKTGSDVVIYGLGAWLLFAVVWTIIVYIISFVIGVDINAENFENDAKYQTFASRIGLLNPGIVYQMAVGLFTHRTLAIDLEGVPGWLVLLSLVLWPLMCLRTATWLFKREMKG